jgi:hypothetical protein
MSARYYLIQLLGCMGLVWDIRKPPRITVLDQKTGDGALIVPWPKGPMPFFPEQAARTLVCHSRVSREFPTTQEILGGKP